MILLSPDGQRVRTVRLKLMIVIHATAGREIDRHLVHAVHHHSARPQNESIGGAWFLRPDTELLAVANDLEGR
jgi:hypothetical protein